MPPKIKIAKEEIISAAVDLVRNRGAESINARTIALALDCSTQPVFSNFENMEELRLAVIEKIDQICQEYIEEEIKKGEYPPYKASGMAYIRFAREEKELFKLLYMRDRRKENFVPSATLNDKMETFVKANTGLDDSDSKLFHLEMWAIVHGIASMVATDFINLDLNLISRMLSDSYQGLCKQFGKE